MRAGKKAGFAWRGWIFENCYLNAPNLPIKTNNNCRKTKLLWHVRTNDCGSWLPETKKLRCGMEATTVVAHGRLPSSSLPFILPPFFCMWIIYKFFRLTLYPPTPSRERENYQKWIYFLWHCDPKTISLTLKIRVESNLKKKTITNLG